MTWTDGYVTDVEYTYGYYAETSPSRIDLALMLAGAQTIPDGPCCELGFGQGVSLAVHAAAHPERKYFGNDFIPQHVQHAESLTRAAGVDAQLSSESFTSFCARDDLPQFALIVAHGIWSWVSDENRHTIVDFVRRKLMPGGVLYISYNTPAGSAATIPLRDLIALHAHRAQAPSLPSSSRVKGALAFATAVFEADPTTAKQIPLLRKRLEGLLEQDPKYVTHEYLNEDWHVASFESIHTALRAAQMTYTAPAMLSEHVPSVQLSAEQRTFLASVPDVVLRETTRDLFTAQAFRRDLWVKGGMNLARADQAKAVRSSRLLLVQSPPTEPIKLRGSRSEASLSDLFSRPILNALIEADVPPTIADLQKQLASPTFNATQIFDAITMLLASGWIAVVRHEGDVRAAAPHVEALNTYTIKRAEDYGHIVHMASSSLGVAIEQSRVNQLFMSAIVDGAESAVAAVGGIASRMAARGERVVQKASANDPSVDTNEALARAAVAYDAERPIQRRLGLLAEL